MAPRKARLLVVGGSGFIGSHVVRRALEIGFSVTSLSLKSRPNGGEEVAHIAADLCDLTVLRDRLSGLMFEYVVNCGGYVDHRPLSGGGRTVVDVHFTGLVNLVECLDRKSLVGFVNIGSSDEYGAAPAPQVESLREAPISPYSLAKVSSTQFLQMMHATEGFPAVTLRLFLTYGPGQSHKRFIPQIIVGCLKDAVFPASGGEQLRDFCYIEDTVDAIFRALETERSRGEVINIGSGQPTKIRDAIELVRTLAGGGSPQYGEVEYRPGENMCLYADISKARGYLNWSPRTDFKTGLEKTIQLFRLEK